MLKSQNRNKLFKILGFFLLVTSLFYLIKTISDFDFLFSEIILIVQSNPLTIVFSILLYVLTYILGSFVWSLWVQKLDDNKKQEFSGYLLLMAVYFYTNLQKYIPGNIFQFVGRNLMGSQYGFGHIALFTASIFEIVISIGSGLLFVLIMTPYFWQELQQIEVLYSTKVLKILTFSVLGIVLSVCVWFFKTKRLTLRDISCYFHNYSNCLAISIVAFLITFGLFGLINLILFNSFFDLGFSYKNFAILAFGFSISWLIGFVVPGSPGGVVIREAAFVLLLNGLVAEKELVYVIIFIRILGIVIEVLLFFIGWLYLIKHKRNGHNLSVKEFNTSFIF